jgi:pimeloyl-ACP methyl ester carboxylesterase
VATDIGTIRPHTLHGDGPGKVIALHGWLSDRHAFDALLPLLDQRAFTLAIPDIRGYGEAMDVPGEFTMDEIARDALALADALGWRTFAVIGHSMGGKVAQRLLATAPDRISKVAAISPVPASGTGFDAPTADFFRRAVTDSGVRRLILDGGTGSRYHDVWLDTMTAYSWTRSTPEAFAAYLASWSAEDFHHEVVGVDVPFKIIVGAHDPDLTADVMRATLLKWFPRAELEVFADAGHYAIDETPIALATVVQRFLTA